MRHIIMQHRRENLRKIIPTEGSQRALAEKVPGFNRSRVSQLIHGKKTFTSDHARLLERYLVLPKGWMDIKDSVNKGWLVIRKYRMLDAAGREACDRVVDFILKSNAPPNLNNITSSLVEHSRGGQFEPPDHKILPFSRRQWREETPY